MWAIFSRQPKKQSMQIEAIYKCVEDEFKAVNQLITTQLSSDVPLVEKIAQYIVESGGKRMRPLLVLLSTRALLFNKSNTEPLTSANFCKLATIIEFLHTATLLHDDVVDTSNMRRGRSTANAKWGNAPSVLVGDFLYSRAFQMMVEIGSVPVMNVLSDATNIIAEGEVFQLMNCKNPDVSEEAYFEVIKNKTAMLFQAASHSAAILAEADTETCETLKNFGLELGLAFQLVDDMLDYVGDADTMGKNIGDDLAEGKPTLPLIYAMKNGTETERKLIRKAIRSGDTSQLDAVCSAVVNSGALKYTEDAAKKCYEKACHSLTQLPDSVYKEALFGLAKLAIHRNK
jgi:octaprenyl-diphosphate synthase|tara:strand:- start:2121 stop:3152 length:1032 start_codon:yes stop_codon:yes gene_type:complete